MALQYATKRSGFGAGVDQSRSDDAARVLAEQKYRETEGTILGQDILNESDAQKLHTYSLEAKQREMERKALISAKKRQINEDPSAQASTIETNRLTEEQAAGNRRALPQENRTRAVEAQLKHKAGVAALTNYERDVYDQEEEKFRRMMSPLFETVQTAINNQVPNKEVYDFLRKQFVGTSGHDPKARAALDKRLEDAGVTREYSEAAWNRFGMMAKRATMTQTATEQANKDREANYRAEIAAEADKYVAEYKLRTATTNANADIKTSQLQIDNTAELLRLYSPKLAESLGGIVTDKKSTHYGRPKPGSVLAGVSTKIAQVSNTAAIDNKVGDPYIDSTMVSDMLIRMTGDLASILSEKRGMIPTTMFNGPMYDRVSSTMLAEMDILRRLERNKGRKYRVIWQENSERLIKRAIASEENRIDELIRQQGLVDTEAAAAAQAATDAEAMATLSSVETDADSENYPDQPSSPVGRSRNSAKEAEVGLVKGQFREAVESRKAQLDLRRRAALIGKKIKLKERNKPYRALYKGDDNLKIMQYARDNLAGMHPLDKKAFLTHFTNGLNKNQKQILKQIAGN